MLAFDGRTLVRLHDDDLQPAVVEHPLNPADDRRGEGRDHLGNDHADRIAPARAEVHGRRIGAIARLLGEPQHPLPRLAADIAVAGQRPRHGRGRQPEPFGQLFDGDAFHSPGVSSEQNYGFYTAFASGRRAPNKRAARRPSAASAQRERSSCAYAISSTITTPQMMSSVLPMA